MALRWSRDEISCRRGISPIPKRISRASMSALVPLLTPGLCLAVPRTQCRAELLCPVP
jgi:hypothetical protein